MNAAPSWTIPEVSGDQCVVLNDHLRAGPGRQLILEAYAFTPSSGADGLEPIATWLSQNAAPNPEPSRYFRDKIANDLVLLSDDRFNYFVRNATLVEPHVRISDETGTADDGGLFYTENLPPESVLVSMVMASRERRKNGSLRSDEVLQAVSGGLNGKNGFHGRMIQVGGDSTVGRGQVLLSFVPTGGSNG